jgi:hypothetical protein
MGGDRRGNYGIWTRADRDVLSREWSRGVAVAEIAARLGRSGQSVQGAAKRFQFRRPIDFIRVYNPPKLAAHSSLRPPHVEGEPFSNDWFASQQSAFVAAMEANPSERPSGHVIHNSSGSTR